MQSQLGSYRLLQKIRSGSHCEVWEAMHDAKKQKFAIKLLPAEQAGDRAEVNYLKHEFAVGHSLEHPRICRIYEFGGDHGAYFLAMELCPSPNLKQLIQQGVEALYPKLPSIIEQAAEGLAYLHGRGWVHRDIKPDNFLFNAKGEVKLIDFALAQRIPRGLMKYLPGRRTSRIQGTRSYISPEQIRGQRLDERADIYSFGCMLFELASGKLPYTGTSTNDLLMKHLKSAAPALQSANRNVTDAFAALVRRMMAKQPQHRPASMEDFLKEFQAISVFK